MVRLAVLLWILAGTVLAGAFVTVVLMMPSLQSQAMKLIPLAALAGAIVAIPLAIVAAKSITSRVNA